MNMSVQYSSFYEEMQIVFLIKICCVSQMDAFK